MSEAFFDLALISTLMVLALALSAEAWLLAIDRRNRKWARHPAVWGMALPVVALVGLALAFLLSSDGDPVHLTRWGRFFASMVHLQLVLDFFIVVFLALNKFWPKGAAVAMASFREAVRQPMFWLLGGTALALMAFSPFLPFFTFGEDLKMVKELCFAFTMLAPVAFAVIAGAISVSEEIEGRTAVTLMSKPISRRQFLLGKFAGILLASLGMTLLLGWFLVWIVVFKVTYDAAAPGFPEHVPDPAVVVETVNAWYPQSSTGDFLKGVGFWIHDAGLALPGLVIGFCQVMVLAAIAISLATRLPMVINVIVCLLIYFLGHLTPVMTEVTRGGNRLVQFVAGLFDTVMPGLDLFDVGSAVIRDVPLSFTAYSLYTLNVLLYAVTYSAIALLFGLILFEDRDLA